MRRTNFILLAAVAAAVLGASIYVYESSRVASKIEAGQPMFPNLRARLNDVRELTIRGPEETVTLRRGGQGWSLAERGMYPAQSEKVRAVLIGLGELKLVERRSDQSELHARMELEDPDAAGAKSRLLRLLGANNEVMAEMVLGRTQKTVTGRATEGYLVRRPAERQAWLAEGDLPLLSRAGQWLDGSLMDVAEARIRQVAITRSGEEPIGLQRDKSDSDFRVLQATAEIETPNVNRARNLARSLERLVLDDVAKLETIDFEQETRINFDFATFDGVRVSFSMVEKDGNSWVRFEAAHDPSAVYPEGLGTLKSPEEARKEVDRINARVKGWAYRLPSPTLSNLKTTLEQLKQ
jgi:Domain of unknown function (DUF4340)